MKHATIIKSIFATVAFTAFGARAETETVDDYTWTYLINGDTAEIYDNNGNGAISPSPTGAVTIPATLGGKPVTSIGSSVFFDCSGLTSVTIPNSVTSIGSSVFFDCSGLTNVTISESNKNRRMTDKWREANRRNGAKGRAVQAAMGHPELVKARAVLAARRSLLKRW